MVTSVIVYVKDNNNMWHSWHTVPSSGITDNGDGTFDFTDTMPLVGGTWDYILSPQGTSSYAFSAPATINCTYTPANYPPDGDWGQTL